jgi:hypothetical protein
VLCGEQGRVSGSAFKVKNMLAGADRRALDDGAGGRQKLLGGGFRSGRLPNPQPLTFSWFRSLRELAPLARLRLAVVEDGDRIPP